MLWITGSALLSWYLANFAQYDATYGSLGAGIGMMMWMWISAIIVLFGAELNSEIEHQTARGNGRRGRPPHRVRAAVTADTPGSPVSGCTERTLALQININAKVAALGEAMAAARGARRQGTRDLRAFRAT